MSTPKNDKAQQRVKFLPLLLAFQMFLPAGALAEGETASERKKQSFEKSMQVLGFLDGLGKDYVQLHQQRMQQEAAQQAAQQFQNTLGIKPVDPSQVPPIISQNGCMVLQARSEQISSGGSCKGSFDINKLNGGQYDALLSIAEQNYNDLENFLTKGHERFTAQGMGCYDKARNQLNQQLSARVEMLEQMKQAIGDKVQAFKKLSEEDLKAIRKGQALLEGPGAADEATKKAMADFKWDSKFSDPACASLMEAKFNETGSKGGFRAISSLLDQNKKNMRAETFFGKKNVYEKEIRKIAREAAKQVKRENDIPQAGAVLSGIRTTEFNPKAKALVQSFDIVAQKAANKRKDMNEELNKIIGGNKELQGFAQLALTDSADINIKLQNWEKERKNECLSGHFQREFGGIDGFLSKLEDPNVSKKANREADSAFKNYVQQILADDGYSVEEKMKKIADKQSESNNSRYGLMTGRSFTVQGKQVGASTRLRAKDMVNLFAQDCRQGFEADAGESGFSGREMVQALRNYAVENKKAKQQFAAELESEILNSMIGCPDRNSVGKTPNTCSKDATNIESAGFCIAAANRCSSNAMSCLDKAEQIVKTTRSEQEAVAKRYKANMDNLKNDLIAEFKAVKASFEGQSRIIDGLFQFGTTYNKDEKPLEASLTLNFDDTQLMDGIDASLAIEDPEKYLAKITKNIDALKGQVEGHNGVILTEFDSEIDKYRENYKTQRDAWKDVISDCAAKVGTEYDTYLNEFNSEQKRVADEQGQDIAEACNKYQNFRANPCPSGSGSEFGDLGNDIAAIAASVDDRKAANEIRGIVAQCDAFSNEDNFALFSPSSGSGASTTSKFNVSLEQFCSDQGSSARACQRYIEASTDSANKCSDRDFEAAYEAYVASGKKLCLDGEKYTSSCDGKEALAANEIAKGELSSALKRIVFTAYNECSTEGKSYEDIKELEDEAYALLNAWKRNELKSEVGEIKVAACEGMNNSDPSMPAFNQEYMRGLAGDLMRAGMGAQGF